MPDGVRRRSSARCARAIVPVAASGNEFDRATRWSSRRRCRTCSRSPRSPRTTARRSSRTRTRAVDLSAPGLDVLTAVPQRKGKRFDSDGTVDGFMQVSGTSFSAPMVSGAVAWIRAARPELTQDQVPERAALRRARHRRPRLRGRDGLRDPRRGRRARPRGAARRPGRAQRGHPLGERPCTARAGEPAVRQGRQRRGDQRHGRRLRGPDRRLPHQGARGHAREDPAHAVGRRPGPVRVPRRRTIGRSAPLARSLRGSGKTDRATVRNRKGRTATYYVAVGFSARSGCGCSTRATRSGSRGRSGGVARRAMPADKRRASADPPPRLDVVRGGAAGRRASAVLPPPTLDVVRRNDAR